MTVQMTVKIIIAMRLLCFASLSQAGPLKLALNWKAEPQFGGFYAAQLEGHFKKQGLEVEILEGGSGTPTVQMLANKKVDFAIVSAEEIIIANERSPENKVTALFAVFQTNPQAIIVRQERGLKSLREVFQSEGVLALQSGLSYAQFLLQKMKPVRVKIVPYPGGVSHLLTQANYSQQGFVTSEPLLAEKSGVKVKSFLVADEGFNPYTTVLATTENHLKDKALIKKVLAAVSAGWVSYLRDPKLTNQKMAKINPGMDLETFAQSAEAQKSLIAIPAAAPGASKAPALGSMSLDRWKTLGEQLQVLGLVRSAPEPRSLFIDTMLYL